MGISKMSLQQIDKEFDDFLTDCANCPECVTDNEFQVCWYHSDEWNQVYKYYWEKLKPKTEFGKENQDD